jgi:dolichyl-phosphate-mannose--protein O-mannosyl transferase
MGLLLALSAGRSTVMGRLALLATLASLAAMVSVYRPLASEGALLMAKSAVLAVAVLGMVLGRRTDTRLIALLFAAAAALPVLLTVWTP